MGMVTHIELRNFRCFEAKTIDLVPGKNAIVGPNARGKTSILEAVHVMLRLASPRTASLLQAVRHGAKGFVVDGYCSGRHMQFYFGRERKKLALDSVVENTVAEYLAVGRAVWFANEDLDLVRGPGEVRRRFLDLAGMQWFPGYREAAREYARALRQRNFLLKASPPRPREVAAFDRPLVEHGSTLMRLRAELVAALAPSAKAAHSRISGEEMLDLFLKPGCEGNMEASLAAAASEDRRLKMTTVGPHRDDLALRVDGHEAALASEGQQRTLVIAIKLALARELAQREKQAPVLLVDDVFGELDRSRRNAFLAGLPPEAQVIATSTAFDWLDDGDGWAIHAFAG